MMFTNHPAYSGFGPYDFWTAFKSKWWGTPHPTAQSCGNGCGQCADCTGTCGGNHGVVSGTDMSCASTMKQGTWPPPLCAPAPPKACATRGCAIPPPPWAPRQVGDVLSCIGAQGKAVLRIQLRNQGYAAHQYSLNSSPTNTAEQHKLEVTPAQFSLGPMEYQTVLVQFTPDIQLLAQAGQSEITTTVERLLWIQGCNKLFLRWVIRIDACGWNSCHELQVFDVEDHTHHWYDHFYCEHPCAQSLTVTPSQAKGAP